MNRSQRRAALGFKSVHSEDEMTALNMQREYVNGLDPGKLGGFFFLHLQTEPSLTKAVRTTNVN